MKDKKTLKWKYSSSENPGFHTVVSPQNSDLKTTWGFRLNLSKGDSHLLKIDHLELNGVVISGEAMIKHNQQSYTLDPRDSFFIPAGQSLRIEAISDLIIFIGGAPYELKGHFFVRKFDLSLPLGNIHQIHGKPPYQREVFMSIAQEDEGSRLICGITEGDPGKWTSWPPHQHSMDLEEIYCYFNIPKPQFVLHLASRVPGEIEEVFPVSTGDFVIIPEGYHPTVGIPGVKSCYFWIMAALSGNSRRYDLAVNDPNFEI